MQAARIPMRAASFLEIFVEGACLAGHKATEFS